MREIRPPRKPLIFYYFIVMVGLMLLNALLFPRLMRPEVKEITYNEFLAMVDQGEVSAVQLEHNRILFADQQEPANA